MGDVVIYPSFLKGELNVPPSKSIMHRAIIASALCKGTSHIENFVCSEDINATLNAIKSLGSTFKINTNSIDITGNGLKIKKNSIINCIESASTLRFLIPIFSIEANNIIFTGCSSLSKRPLYPYFEIFNKQNIKYKTSKNSLPLTINGKLKPGIFYIPGNISSQFISGLLFALPLLNDDSKIILTTALESKGYVDLTIQLLKQFSVQVENNNYNEFYIKGNQKYKPACLTVESDFSQAAFFLAAGALNGDISINNLNIASLQADKIIIDVLARMGANINYINNSINIKKSRTHGIIFDAKNNPDLVPIISVLASLSVGTTKIINAKRLRLKESDRLRSVYENLKKLGCLITENEDGLIINGAKYLNGGNINGFNDHRIVMAFSIAALRAKAPTLITDREAVKKSYPDFFEQFKSLGGIINEN